jgi:hypothetical protein
MNMRTRGKPAPNSNLGVQGKSELGDIIWEISDVERGGDDLLKLSAGRGEPKD